MQIRLYTINKWLTKVGLVLTLIYPEDMKDVDALEQYLSFRLERYSSYEARVISEIKAASNETTYLW
jgi:hypothetical protein